MGSTNTHSSCLSAEPSHCCSKATADSLGNAKNVYRTPGSRDLSNFDVELEAAFRKAFGYPLADSNTAVNSCPALADRHANKSVSAPPRKRRECRKFSPAAVATSPDLSQILWSHVRGHINSPLWSNRLPFGKFNSLYIHLVFYDLQRGPCSKFWSAATRMWKACAGIVMAMQQRQSREKQSLERFQTLPAFRLDPPLQLKEPEAVSSAYQHNRLRSSTSIRLLNIGSGSQLQFKLQEFDINSTPQYCSLSYVWGSEADKISILLDGYRFDVTRSLHLALCGLSSMVRKRNLWIWVDAICINQSDEDEKGSQVAMMRDIYDGATLIIAHLGCPKNPAVAERVPQLVSTLLSIKALTVGHFIDPKSKFIEQMKTMSQSFFSDISEIYKAPWWTRAWIVQEATRSTPTILVHGGLGVSMKLVSVLYAGLSSFDSRYIFTLRPCFPILSIVQTGRLRGSMDSTLPLLNALDKVVEQSCKIGRDKINAALGLIDKAQARRIIPDYTKSLREILVDVAVCCLNQDEVAHRLDFLGCLAPPPHQAVSEFPGTLLKIPPATQPLVYWLPSWLPDWTRGTTKPWDRCGSRMRLPYAFTTEFCHSVYHPHVTDGKFLHLHGWRKDYVDIIRPVPFGYLKDLCSRHPFRDELNTVFDIASFAEISGVGVPPQLVEVFSKMFQPSMMPSMGALITDNMYDIFAQYQWLPATTKGLGFGIFPTRAKKGDVICSFIGGSVYYVLRSTGHNPDTYNFIGEAYMFGEMKSLQGEGPPEKFTLV